MSASENRLSSARELRKPARRGLPWGILAPALCLLFAALCLWRGGYFAPKAVAPAQVEKTETSAFEQLIPESAGTPWRVIISDGGASYALASENGQYLLDGEADGVDAAMAAKLLGSGASILARNRLEGTPSDFGIDDAALRATYDYDDGTSVTVIFGGAPATGEGRYAAVDGRDGVFVVNAALYQTVSAGKNALYSLPDLSAVYTSQTLMQATIAQPGKETVALRRVTEENPFNTLVEFVEPIHYPANSERAASLFLALEALAPERVLGEADDGAYYGLDAPIAVLTLEGPERTIVLNIGATSDGLTLTLDGERRVYALPSGSMDFLQTVSVAYLAEQLPGLVAMNRVETLELRREDTAYLLRVDRSNGTAYFIDDVPLSEADFKKLYQAAIGLLIDQYKKGGFEGTQPRATFTYALDDDTIWTLGFAPVDGEYDAVLRDGESCFLIARAKVDAVFELASTLANGGAADE